MHGVGLFFNSHSVINRDRYGNMGVPPLETVVSAIFRQSNGCVKADAREIYYPVSNYDCKTDLTQTSVQKFRYIWNGLDEFM